MRRCIRRRTSDADQDAVHGTWCDEAGYGDRDAADYQSQQHSGLDGETSAEVPPSPLPGVKGALTHHLQAGGGIPSGPCALRGGVSLSAESDRHLDLTISPPVSKHPADDQCQQDVLMVATCHWQLAGTTRSGHDRVYERTIYIIRR